MTSNDEKGSNSNQLPAKNPIFLINSPPAVLRRSITAPQGPASIITIEKRWNTAHLPWRIFADATAAASTAFLIAPIITSIDRYVHLIVLTSSSCLKKSHVLDTSPTICALTTIHIQGNNRECVFTTHPSRLPLLLSTNIRLPSSHHAPLPPLPPHLRPLLLHLPDRKRRRHHLGHHSRQARRNNDLRAREIPSHHHGQYVRRPLQGLSVCENVWKCAPACYWRRPWGGRGNSNSSHAPIRAQS